MDGYCDWVTASGDEVQLTQTQGRLVLESRIEEARDTYRKVRMMNASLQFRRSVLTHRPVLCARVPAASQMVNGGHLLTSDVHVEMGDQSVAFDQVCVCVSDSVL